MLITRAEINEKSDPALEPFLSFMANDIANHPERLQAVDPAFVERVQSLVAGVEINLDAPLSKSLSKSHRLRMGECDANVISPGAKANQGDWLIGSGIAPR